MTVITIEYQMGCGGRAIGRLLADLLGFSYMDREIVQGVARELHTDEGAAEQHDERVAGLVERTLTMLWAAGDLTGGAAAAPSALTMFDDEVYHEVTCQVIEAAARRGQAVIVGHGASFALAGWPGAMHVGLYAPLERRVATIMERLQVDQAEARRQVTQCDQERARYIKRFHDASWRDAEHYHLMIDTAVFAPGQAVELIAQAWRAWLSPPRLF